MYEGQYIVNSFHAVNQSTNEIIQADEKGNITLSQGDTVVFKSIYADENVSVNTIVFFAGDDPVKVQLNDNTVYPFYVEAGSKRGVKNMRVYSFTALEACTLYYEGIVC
jgi:hypothetical protein